MVAIKLIVASLASLALAHPIEPRSPDLSDNLADLLGELGNTDPVSKLTRNLLYDIPQFTSTLSDRVRDLALGTEKKSADFIAGLLDKIDGPLGKVVDIVGKISPELGDAVGDLLKSTDLGNIFDQLLDSVKEIQQELPDGSMTDSLLTTLKSLLGKVTSLKDKLPSTDDSSYVVFDLRELEDTLGDIVDDAS
uniref:ARAD1A14762p n=1 Tax=Blastobotrys adeninivorans TaxID=409370 RepID=A0A060T3F6_BLAAD